TNFSLQQLGMELRLRDQQISNLETSSFKDLHPICIGSGVWARVWHEYKIEAISRKHHSDSSPKDLYYGAIQADWKALLTREMLSTLA
ncbi:hypothetical protein KCU66_g18307, partial [Aureobasidium melanogenum]